MMSSKYLLDLKDKMEEFKKSNISVEEEKDRLEELLEENHLSKNVINSDGYVDVLTLGVLAAKVENPIDELDKNLEIVRHQAFRLMLAFGSFKNVYAFLERYSRYLDEEYGEYENNEIRLFHDASDFQIPPSNQLNVVLWQDILNKNKPRKPNDNIVRNFALADKIELYICENKDKLEEEYLLKLREQDVKRFTEEYLQIDNKENWTNLLGKQKFAIKTYDQLKLFQSQDDYVQARLKQTRGERKNKKDAFMKDILRADTSARFINEIASRLFYQNSPENPEAAQLFHFYKKTEEDFNKYLSLIPSDSNENIPSVHIDGAKMNPAASRYSINKVDPHHPMAALLGEVTSCCQSLGREGEKVTIRGIEDEAAGFYAIYNKATNVPVAQALSWRETGIENDLVLDSIEGKSDFKRESLGLYKAFPLFLAYQLGNECGVPAIIVGGGGETPKGLKIFELKEVKQPATYDSDIQYYLYHSRLPFFNVLVDENPDCQISIRQVNAGKPLDMHEIITWLEFCVNLKREDYVWYIIPFVGEAPGWPDFFDKFYKINSYICSLVTNELDESPDFSDKVELLSYLSAENKKRLIEWSIENHDLKLMQLIIQENAKSVPDLFCDFNTHDFMMSCIDRLRQSSLNKSREHLREIILSKLEELFNLFLVEPTEIEFYKNYTISNSEFWGIEGSYLRDPENTFIDIKNRLEQSSIAHLNDNNKQRLMQMAILHSDVDIILNILRNDPDFLSQNIELSHSYIFHAKTWETLDTLLENGLSIDVRDSGGRSIFFTLGNKENWDMLVKLIDKWVRQDSVTEFAGDFTGALQFAMRIDRVELLEAVKKKNLEGFNVHFVFTEALFYSASASMKYMLEHFKVDLNVQYNSHSYLYYALHDFRIVLAELLIGKGAGLTDNDKNSLVQLVKENPVKHADKIEFILNKGLITQQDGEVYKSLVEMMKSHKILKDNALPTFWQKGKFAMPIETESPLEGIATPGYKKSA